MDREWEGGFSVTVAMEPWRPNVPVHLELKQPAQLGQLFHADALAS